MTFPTSRFVVITGTDTGVGKTVTTAALAVAFEALGRSVAVVKPVQTGVDWDESGDIDEIVRLTGLTDVHEFTRRRAALAPESAAMRQNAGLPTIAELTTRIRAIDADIVLIEGAGGLLVHIDLIGGTIFDLAIGLAAEVVIVGREGLGTLNHFALTVEHLRTARIEPRLVFGSCSPDPGLAERTNHNDLPRNTGLPIEACIPEGAGTLTREEFRNQAPSWFTPRFDR
ncbi:MAG: dethiobiotin synthase [Kineosporiaceae bacterium]|nr:dethiobiotin synthase [Aeromicrobium sp.]